MKKLILTLLCTLVFATSLNAETKYGVYQKLFDLPISYDDALLKLGSFEHSDKLNAWDVNVEAKLGRAHVMIFGSDEMLASVATFGKDALFIYPLKVALIEEIVEKDGKKIKNVFINMVNSKTLSKVVFGKTDKKQVPKISAVLDKYEKTIIADLASYFAVEAAVTQLSPQKNERDMLNYQSFGVPFIMPSKNFPQAYKIGLQKSKISSYKETVDTIRDNIVNNTLERKWTIKYDLGNDDMWVFGVSSKKVEKRALNIIGKSDHAASFPIEIVVFKDGSKVKIDSLFEMWRMDLYFSDASMMAFSANMTMPSELDNSLKKMMPIK
jgi:hypothetical protein